MMTAMGAAIGLAQGEPRGQRAIEWEEYHLGEGRHDQCNRDVEPHRPGDGVGWLCAASCQQHSQADECRSVEKTLSENKGNCWPAQSAFAMCPGSRLGDAGASLSTRRLARTGKSTTGTMKR